MHCSTSKREYNACLSQLRYTKPAHPREGGQRERGKKGTRRKKKGQKGTVDDRWEAQTRRGWWGETPPHHRAQDHHRTHPPRGRKKKEKGWKAAYMRTGGARFGTPP